MVKFQSLDQPCVLNSSARGNLYASVPDLPLLAIRSSDGRAMAQPPLLKVVISVTINAH